MNYMASISDFFKSPKWGMNLLLGAVCCLIPFVGPMVLLGWLLNGFWGRNDERPETFPDFNFDKFGKNLERGLWPTLVSLVALVVIIPVIIIMVVVAAIGGAAASGSDHASGGIGILMFLMMAIVMLMVMFLLSFLLVPMILRASLLQDFGSAFNIAFVKRFISLTKTELALSMLFICAATFVLIVVSSIPCLGTLLIFAVIPPLHYAWNHLTKQLYKLYLSRGGEALTISPKLEDLPAIPPSPPAAA